MPEHATPEDGGPFLESELSAPEPAVARRRRVPGWLIPTVAALVVGVLAGALLFGGDPTTRSGTPGDRGRPDRQRRRHRPARGHRADPGRAGAGGHPRDRGQLVVGRPGAQPGRHPRGAGRLRRAGWFTGGNYPGDPQGPPGLIAGHVDDFTGPAVFYRLRDLAVGDEVMVTRADNTVAVFTVTASDEYPKDAFPAAEVYAPVGDSELVLITCTGTFDQGARSYEDNLVVRATLDLARSLEESDVRIASGAAAPAADQPNV